MAETPEREAAEGIVSKWWATLYPGGPNEALREALDEEADAAVRAYIEAVGDTLGARPIDARVALKRAIERARKGE